MMKGFLKTFCLLTFITFMGVLIPVNAQVTIGSEYLPESGAALEIKENQVKNPADIPALENSKKGLLFPKVKLISRNSLIPLYDDPVTSDDRMLATGMVVYNINPDAIELTTGLFVWDSQQWISLNGKESPEAEFELLPCTSQNIQINGLYYKDIPLNSSRNNTISLRVKVIKAGTYNIVGETDPENGYYFSDSGEFPTTGTFTITLTGFGTPINKGKNKLIVKALSTPVGDVELYDCMNITVEDLPYDAVLCEGVSVTSSLVKGKVAKSTDAYIDIELSLPEDLIGQDYVIVSGPENTDAPQFNHKSGTFTDTQENIRLNVKDGITPQKNGTFKYIFAMQINGKSIMLSCTAELSISTRIINVAAFSEGGGCYRDVTYKTNVVKMMLENKDLFGPSPDAFYQVEGINLWRESNSLKYISSAIQKGADIILVVFNAGEAAIYTDEVMWQLANFVTQQGKVLIYCTDLNDASEKKNTVSIVNKIVGTNLAYNTDIEYKHETWAKQPLPLLPSPVTSPRYENIDLVGKNFGIDDYYNGQIVASKMNNTGVIPLVKTTNKSNVSNIRAFLYEKKGGFIWWGDAGPFQGRYNGGGYSTNGYTWPAAVDASGKPTVRYRTTGCEPYYDGGVWNSYVFVNVMAWAIDIVLKNDTK